MTNDIETLKQIKHYEEQQEHKIKEAQEQAKQILESAKRESLEIIENAEREGKAIYEDYISRSKAQASEEHKAFVSDSEQKAKKLKSVKKEDVAAILEKLLKECFGV